MTHNEMDKKSTLLGKGADALEADMAFNTLATNSNAPADGKIAIFARHSMSADSLEEQIKAVNSIASLVGDTDCDVYKEIAGPYDESYGQQDKLLEAIQKGEIKRIYVKSRDRFSKDPVRSLKFAQAVVDNDVEITEVNSFVL